MNCDQCDKPAVVHEVVIKNGVTKEVHLCAEHAAEKGFQVPLTPVAQLLTQFVGQGEAKGRKGATLHGCSGCGLTFQEFRQSGTLGCPACYDAFMPQLGSLIERAHAGATHHTGRTPTRLEGLADRTLARQKLVQELEAAVAAEQYERAARIRDQLHQVDSAAGRMARGRSRRSRGAAEGGDADAGAAGGTA